MHYADFAQAILRGIDDAASTIERQVMNGLPDHLYREALARRKGLLEARQLITDALGRNETGLTQSR